MDIHNINNDILKKVVVEGNNILSTNDPIPLMRLISTGQLSRFEAWNLLRCIHNGELDCNLGSYGTLTVFSLAKDLQEFFRLYDQGVQMLRDAGSLPDEIEQWAAEQSKKFTKKPIKVVIKFKKKSKSVPKLGLDDDNENRKNFNPRLN